MLTSHTLILTALIAVCSLSCASSADPAPLPPDVASSLIQYEKIDGLCSAGDFELPAFDVPTWLTVWPCDVTELTERSAELECWDPAVITAPRLVVRHSWTQHADGHVTGSAEFTGPTCSGSYVTRYR